MTNTIATVYRATDEKALQNLRMISDANGWGRSGCALFHENVVVLKLPETSHEWLRNRLDQLEVWVGAHYEHFDL